MANNWFRFKQFTVQQQSAAMKVTTDGCLFGAWAAREIHNSKPKVTNILDVGAGTGLLSLMVAQKTKVDITAVEIDPDAATEATGNFRTAPWSGRLNLVHGDILQIRFAETFDAIVCNPPFYESDLKGPDRKRNMAHHSTDLNANDLLPALYRNLSPQGALYLLLAHSRKDVVLGKSKEAGLFPHAQVEVVPEKRPTRCMVALKKHKAPKVAYNILRIKNGTEYSTEFKSLLEDYYLYL